MDLRRFKGIGISRDSKSYQGLDRDLQGDMKRYQGVERDLKGDLKEVQRD